MGRRDSRWEPLLAEVERLRGTPVKHVHEKGWEAQLKLGPVEQWKKQSNACLMNFTKASARDVVEAGDVQGVLDACRPMADKGTLRESLVMTLREKTYSPRKGVQAKDLEVTIAN